MSRGAKRTPVAFCLATAYLVVATEAHAADIAPAGASPDGERTPEAARTDAGCFPHWLPFVEIGGGAIAAAVGSQLFGHRMTGHNPTAPALLLGVGGGTALSGLALLDANARCARGETTGPDFRRVQRRLTFVTAGAATLTVGLAGAFTLSDNPGQGPGQSAYAIGGLFMGLAAATTVLGLHIVLAPEVPPRSAASLSRPSFGVTPTQRGAVGTMFLSF